MNNAALKFVCYEKKDVPDFINETVKSKKWSTTFGLSPELSDATSNPTIQALIRAYKESGNKEKAAETRKRAAGQKAKIFIGNSVKNSRISLTGEFTSDQFKHRTDAAKSILVVSPRMQMNGVDCCQLWQWTTLTDCCRNCLVALQTRWQQPKSIVFYLDLVEHHLLSLNSLASVSVLRCWGKFPNFSRETVSTLTGFDFML